MLYSSVILSCLMALASAAPASNDLRQRSPEVVQLKDGSSILISDSTSDKKRSPDGAVQLHDGTVMAITDSTEDRKAKRAPEIIVLRDGSNLTVTDIDDDGDDDDNDDDDALVKRNSNYVSSCGPKSGWIPVDDHYSTSTGTKWWGYTSTVAEYCSRISFDLNGNPLILQPHKKASYTVRYENDSDNSGTRVALDNEIPGHIEFEINNKSGAEHRVNEDSCKQYLMAMASTSSKCYGTKHKDTKGGTWQIGSNEISYHALPAAN